MDEKDFWSYVNLSSIYEEVGLLEKALCLADKALELYPNHYMPLFNKGVVYKKLNKLEEAISNYKLSIEDNENYSYSYLNLAVIYKELKDYKKL